MPDEPEMVSTRIIVDADACPRTVLGICTAVAREKQAAVITVASHNHLINSDCHVTVGDAPQAADLRILNLSRKGDVVVTQDWGLAAMVLGKEARCLSPSGRQYRPETIDTMLEIRDMKARHRRTGGRTRGPRKRTADDDRRFEEGLRRILE